MINLIIYVFIDIIIYNIFSMHIVYSVFLMILSI